jgi:hypothetical protein
VVNKTFIFVFAFLFCFFSFLPRGHAEGVGCSSIPDRQPDEKVLRIFSEPWCSFCNYLEAALEGSGITHNSIIRVSRIGNVRVEIISASDPSCRGGEREALGNLSGGVPDVRCLFQDSNMNCIQIHSQIIDSISANGRRYVVSHHLQDSDMSDEDAYDLLRNNIIHTEARAILRRQLPRFFPVY